MGFDVLAADLEDVQLQPTELRLIVKAITSRPGCSLLIFGCGNDSVLWEKVNRNGTTAFLEDDPEWLELARSRLTTAEAHLVRYGTQQSDWILLMNSPPKLELDLPAAISSRRWDVVLVDGPRGTEATSPAGWHVSTPHPSSWRLGAAFLSTIATGRSSVVRRAQGNHRLFRRAVDRSLTAMHSDTASPRTVGGCGLKLGALKEQMETCRDEPHAIGNQAGGLAALRVTPNFSAGGRANFGRILEAAGLAREQRYVTQAWTKTQGDVAASPSLDLLEGSNGTFDREIGFRAERVPPSHRSAPAGIFCQDVKARWPSARRIFVGTSNHVCPSMSNSRDAPTTAVATHDRPAHIASTMLLGNLPNATR